MSNLFYVGYQKQMPPPIAAFLRARIAIALVLALVLALVIVKSQTSFPNSQFEFGTYRDFEGIISALPYPTLILCTPEKDCSRYLLVKPGKHGAGELFTDGAHVKLRGSLIYRDNQKMIEVDPASVAAPHVRGGRPGSAIPATVLGKFILRGEIVDSKCFLGVMKPGNLKPHKACAIRCISGGCPPVLVVRDASGMAAYFVLAAADGGPMGREVLNYVAEPVEITGEVEKRDDLFVLKADPLAFRRIE